MYLLYISYINEATNFVESLGGGIDTKDWGYEKDEALAARSHRPLHQVAEHEGRKTVERSRH